MNDIRPFLCSREECIDLIKTSINQYSRSELYKKLSTSITNSIIRQIHDKFCLVNYDDFGNIYLYDELNPTAITDYIMETKKYEAEKDLIYAFVCRTLMKCINTFYKELKLYTETEEFDLRFSRVPINKEVYMSKYIQLLDNRAQFPFPQLRGK